MADIKNEVKPTPNPNGKTPFEKAGYTKNSLFENISSQYFAKSSTLELYKDDGSYSPAFIKVGCEDGEYYYETFAPLKIKYIGEKDDMSRTDVVDKSKEVVQYKVGDKVRLIKAGEYCIPKVGGILTVKRLSFGGVAFTCEENSYKFKFNHFELVNDSVKEEYPHTATVRFFNDDGSLYHKEYFYKCDESVYEYTQEVLSKAELTPGGIPYYKYTVDVYGKTKPVVIAGIRLNFTDPLATKCLPKYIKEELQDKKEESKIVITTNGTLSSTTKVKEEVKMSNVNPVQLVNIKLFDDDQGLKPEDRIVAFHSNFATTSSNEKTICNALLKLDIAGEIAVHNAKREKTVDLTVIKNTGNKVFLQPIEFDDLRVEITRV